ncbi:MAG TPA: winged helix-turn-helix domain-containing protein [Pyrinomonadaceae bacterium]|nr:winged helix-turn-helix domain-containing protein [Pyrinomonadaceae bacterium]
MPIYKFRNCYLNTVERQAVMDGKYLKLTPKTLDLLQLLIEKRGDVVSKDEILEKVWHGSFVEEGNLPVHVSTLRRSFGESRIRTFIETVPGVGYRFISPVALAREKEWEKQLIQQNRLTHKTESKNVFDSIAILPLNNESNDPEIDYLVDGLTEKFINSLSHISGLRVLARNTVFRYKNKNTDAKRVGETLGVETVLTGRLRIIKDRIIISVELTDISTGGQLWGTQFNQPFTDIIEVEEKITAAVSEKLSSEISQVARSSAGDLQTKNTESYRLYFKGKYFQEKRSGADIYKAIEYFKQSIAQDPDNIYSYIEICESYYFLYMLEYISYEEALSSMKPFWPELSEKTRSIDALHALYGRKAYLNWDFEKAERHYKKAIDINPNFLSVQYRYGQWLVGMGRIWDGLEQLTQVIRLDPLSINSYKEIAKFYYQMREYENALMYAGEALELEPDDHQALSIMGCILAATGEYDEAGAAFQKSLSVAHNTETFAMTGYVYARAGKRNEAYQVLEQLYSLEYGYVGAYLPAVIYSALGENDKAFEHLELAFERHEADLCLLKVNPRLDTLRDDPRFDELMIRMGFPEK